MNTEHNRQVLQQFLETSKFYLTMQPIELDPAHLKKATSGRALIRPIPLPRSMVRQGLQTNVVRAFAGRHRFR